MKKFIFIFILFIPFSFSAQAQETVTLPKDVAVEALRAVRLVPELEEKIKTLEAQRITPCSVALTQAETMIANIPVGEPTDTKAMIEERRQRRKLTKTLIINSVKAQCSWPERESVWKQVLKYLPIAAALLLKG